MLRNISILVSIAIVIGILGCSPKHTDSKPEGVLTNAQKKTLNNANKVNEVLNNANEKRLKEIDEMNK